MIGELGSQLQRRIGKAFPHALGEAPPSAVGRDDARRALIEGRVQGGWPVRAKSSGFLQVVETENLIAAARRANLVLRLDCRPGDYVADGDTLLYASPAEPLDEEARERVIKEGLDGHAFGKGRTVNQDVRLPVDRLVEVAVRALSPGINDPFTANDCMDALGRGMHEAANRLPSDLILFDKEDRLRVITESMNFEELVERAFGRPGPTWPETRSPRASCWRCWAATCWRFRTRRSWGYPWARRARCWPSSRSRSPTRSRYRSCGGAWPCWRASRPTRTSARVSALSTTGWAARADRLD